MTDKGYQAERNQRARKAADRMASTIYGEPAEKALLDKRVREILIELGVLPPEFLNKARQRFEAAFLLKEQLEKQDAEKSLDFEAFERAWPQHVTDVEKPETAERLPALEMIIARIYQLRERVVFNCMRLNQNADKIHGAHPVADEHNIGDTPFGQIPQIFHGLEQLELAINDLDYATKRNDLQQ